MKFESIKKILKKVYKYVIILNLLFFFIEFLVILLGDHIEYPKLFFDKLGINQYYFLLITVIFPTLFSLVGIFILNHIKTMNYFKTKCILLIISLLISLPIGFQSNIVLFIAPPIESYTNSTKDYLKVSDDVQKHKDIFEFFPQEIPENATDVHYSYKKYMGLIETDIKISASWSLPDDSYKSAKKIIQDTCTMEAITYNKFKIHPHNSYGRDDFLDLNFEYDDDSKTLTYTATYKE